MHTEPHLRRNPYIQSGRRIVLGGIPMSKGIASLITATAIVAGLMSYSSDAIAGGRGWGGGVGRGGIGRGWGFGAGFLGGAVVGGVLAAPYYYGYGPYYYPPANYYGPYGAPAPVPYGVRAYEAPASAYEAPPAPARYAAPAYEAPAPPIVVRHQAAAKMPLRIAVADSPSYDPSTATYMGRNGRREPCP